MPRALPRPQIILMTVGLDINEEEGNNTVKMAREMGGQMIFIGTDLTKNSEMDYAVAEAAKMGTIRYLVNVAGIQHIDYVEDFPIEKYDLMQNIMLRAPVLPFQINHSSHETIQRRLRGHRSHGLGARSYFNDMQIVV